MKAEKEGSTICLPTLEIFICQCLWEWDFHQRKAACFICAFPQAWADVFGSSRFLLGFGNSILDVSFSVLLSSLMSLVKDSSSASFQ